MRRPRPTCVPSAPSSRPCASGSMPSSSRASRSAVSSSEPSPGSQRPPGSAACPDQGSSGCSARRASSTASSCRQTSTAASMAAPSSSGEGTWASASASAAGVGNGAGRTPRSIAWAKWHSLERPGGVGPALVGRGRHLEGMGQLALARRCHLASPRSRGRSRCGLRPSRPIGTRTSANWQSPARGRSRAGLRPLTANWHSRECQLAGCSRSAARPRRPQPEAAPHGQLALARVPIGTRCARPCIPGLAPLQTCQLALSRVPIGRARVRAHATRPSPTHPISRSIRRIRRVDVQSSHPLLPGTAAHGHRRPPRRADSLRPACGGRRRAPRRPTSSGRSAAGTCAPARSSGHTRWRPGDRRRSSSAVPPGREAAVARGRSARPRRRGGARQHAVEHVAEPARAARRRPAPQRAGGRDAAVQDGRQAGPAPAHRPERRRARHGRAA